LAIESRERAASLYFYAKKSLFFGINKMSGSFMNGLIHNFC
jgi:hypothetical protein